MRQLFDQAAHRRNGQLFLIIPRKIETWTDDVNHIQNKLNIPFAQRSSQRSVFVNKIWIICFAINHKKTCGEPELLLGPTGSSQKGPLWVREYKLILVQLPIRVNNFSLGSSEAEPTAINPQTSSCNRDAL